MTVSYIHFTRYSLVGLLITSLTSTSVLGIHHVTGYDMRLTKREDSRYLFMTQSTPSGLVYSGLECTTSVQPNTPIPSLMASLGRGYRYHLTSETTIGAYVFIDYGLDQHHKLHTIVDNWLQPIKQSSLAAAYLLRSIASPSPEAQPQDTQFVNVNIGFEYWLSVLKSQLNVYFPLYTDAHPAPKRPFYIENGYYGADLQWVYKFNSKLVPFTGFYGFYQPNQPTMAGWACGLTATLHPQYIVDFKYSIDSLRGHTWSIVLQTQLTQWLKFYYKYTYDAEQGHTNLLPNARSLFFGLQWNVNFTPQRDNSRFPNHRHLSPVMLRVPA